MPVVTTLASPSVFPRIGVCVARDPGAATAASDAALLAMIRGVGARVMRLTLDWARCERTAGVYTWGQYDSFIASLRAAGVLPLLIVQQGNPLYTGTWDKPPVTPGAQSAYAAFVKATIQHFGIGVCWYEILNEPNNPAFGAMTGAQYGALVSAVTAAVRPSDPWSYLLTAGPSYHDKAAWLEALGAATDLTKVTAIGDHPYTGGDAYWRNDPSCLPEGMPTLLQQTVVAAGGKRLAWNTEAGVSVTECDGAAWADKLKRQGVHAARFVLASLMVGTRQALSCWYALQDTGADQNDREQNFGLYDVAGVLKPAGRQFTAITALVNAAQSITVSRDGGLYRTDFTVAAGDVRSVCWSASDAPSPTLTLAQGDGPMIVAAT